MCKQGMGLKSMSANLKDLNTGVDDGSNLLHSYGLVFQNLSNCNIVMVSRQVNNVCKVLHSLGGL